MKKLLTILLICISFNGFAQTMPYFSAGQSTQLRAYMKHSLDSAYKIWIADAKKADSDLLKILPQFRKSTLDSLEKLNTYIVNLEKANKALTDSVTAISKRASTTAQDTSWKASIRDLQGTVDKIAAVVANIPASQVTAADLKAVADKIEAMRAALINWNSSLKL